MRVGISIFSVFLLSGCLALDSEYQANKAAHEAGQTKPPNTEKCIYIAEVGSWESFSPHHLYVRDAADDGQYLLTMRSMCPGIMQRVVIDFPYNGGQICRAAGDRLTYKDSAHRRSCSISDFAVVDSRDEAEQLAAADDT